MLESVISVLTHGLWAKEERTQHRTGVSAHGRVSCTINAEILIVYFRLSVEILYEISAAGLLCLVPNV